MTPKMNGYKPAIHICVELMKSGQITVSCSVQFASVEIESESDMKNHNSVVDRWAAKRTIEYRKQFTLKIDGTIVMSDFCTSILSACPNAILSMLILVRLIHVIWILS